MCEVGGKHFTSMASLSSDKCYKVLQRRSSRRFQRHGATYKTSVLGLKMVVTADEKAVRRLLQVSPPIYLPRLSNSSPGAGLKAATGVLSTPVTDSPAA